MYMSLQACASGLAWGLRQLYLLYPFHDEKKISYLIDCIFDGVHVHRANFNISTTSVGKIHINHLRKIPNYMWFWLFPATETPKNHEHICCILMYVYIHTYIHVYTEARISSRLCEAKWQVYYSYWRAVRYLQHYIWSRVVLKQVLWLRAGTVCRWLSLEAS